MAYGGIWVNRHRGHENRDLSSNSDRQKATEDHSLCFNDGEQTRRITSNQTIFLPRGEIGVIGCVSNPIVPLINLNLRRRPDIDLRPGEFARIRCGGNFLDVVCGSKRILRTNISLFPTEYVLVTCNITRNR